MPRRQTTDTSAAPPGDGLSGTLKQWNATITDVTRVNLKLFYDRKGFEVSEEEFFSLIARRIDNDLQRFKKFIEERQRETGGRGTPRQ
ncbi:MAG: hypothetical protein WD688_16740 [Candidatus Binatia bacterium]